MLFVWSVGIKGGAMVWNEVILAIAAGISIIITVISLIVAVRPRILKRIRIGSFLEFGATQKALEEAYSRIASDSVPSKVGHPPFETEHLARYYAQILVQSKIVFWFSLGFASLGFTVIVAAAFMYWYSDGNVSATVIQGTSGIIVNAVAALFFVQSKRAQASMAQFFDKLRMDRHQVESRALCDSIHDPKARDALKIQLSLYYAGIDKYETLAQHIIDACIGSGKNHDN
jgi:hypothetical protein